MRRQKILTISIILVLSTTPILSSLSALSSSTVRSFNLTVSEGSESHVIEGVPYISPGQSSRCPYNTVTMIVQYYGINATAGEVFHHSGGGYSFGYKLIYPLRLWSGFFISQGPDDRRFLAELYGLSFDYWFSLSKTRSDECWGEYWARVKQNITRDIPLITVVNMDALYEDINVSVIHYILLVGFNETNGTVCFHDAGVGAYIWIPKETLQNALYQVFVTDRFFRTIYFIEGFENTSKSPLSPKERFEKAHLRNIERMKGNLSAYDEDVFRKIFGMRIFGINAIKCLKNDFHLRNLVLFNLLPDSHFLTLWTSPGSYFMVSVEKYDVSQYLWDVYDQNLSSTIGWDAWHLELESNLWSRMLYFMRKLNNTFESNNLLKAILLLLPIIKEIRSTIDTIISIEKAIIEGPPRLNPT